MKKIIIGLTILGLIFALGVGFKNFALGQENSEENEFDIKNVEKFMKKHMEKVMDEIERIGKDMDKTPRVWGKQSFFTLTPSNQVMAGGTLENVTTTGFTLNTNGFRTNWIVATETKIVSSNKENLNLNALQTDNSVRVKGEWNGQNFIAKVVIVFQAPTVQPQLHQVQNLILQIINILRERGIDVTPILQRLQTTTPTQ